MKFIKTLFSISLFSLAFQLQAQNIDSMLQAHYSLESSTIKDNSTNNITGTNSNASLVDSDEDKLGDCYEFDGSKSHIDLGKSNRNVSSQVTVSAWIKTTSNKRQFAVCKYNSKDSKGYYIGVEGGVGFIGGRDGSSNAIVHAYGTTEINDGEWHHLVGVVDKNVWMIWVDCSLEKLVATSVLSTKLDCSDPLVLGMWYEGNGYGEYRYFDGMIDEVRLYNRAISNSEIDSFCQLYKCGELEDEEPAALERSEVKNGLKVFPNPSSSTLTVEGSADQLGADIKYEIYNIYGQVVLSGTLEGTIDISQLTSGEYFVTILEDTKQYQAQKFVKL